jgi:peroxidase
MLIYLLKIFLVTCKQREEILWRYQNILPYKLKPTAAYVQYELTLRAVEIQLREEMASATTLVMLVAAVACLCAPAAAGDGNADATRQPPVVSGLSFDFYRKSCPKAESVVRKFVRDAVRKDIGLAAGLLRLHFHDCFVQGCDASVLLDGSATGPGERQAPPNLTLRPSAFKAVNDIRDRLEKACGATVVSCSDILALAARDSVVVVNV